MKPISQWRWIGGRRKLQSPGSRLSDVSGASARPTVILENDERIRKVATYFSDSFEYWDRVYSSDTVKAQVYRNRMGVVVRWATMVAGPGAAAADIGTGAGHCAVTLAQRRRKRGHARPRRSKRL